MYLHLSNSLIMLLARFEFVMCIGSLIREAALSRRAEAFAFASEVVRNSVGDKEKMGRGIIHPKGKREDPCERPARHHRCARILGPVLHKQSAEGWGNPTSSLWGRGSSSPRFPSNDHESIGEISIATTEGRISGILARRRGERAATGGLA